MISGVKTNHAKNQSKSTPDAFSIVRKKSEVWTFKNFTRWAYSLGKIK